MACDDLLGLDEAIQKLEQKDPRKAALVKLRFFAGLTTAQAAQSLGISATTAENDWSYARSWLRLEMLGGTSEEISRIFPESVRVRSGWISHSKLKGKVSRISGKDAPMTSRQLDEEEIFHIARPLTEVQAPLKVSRSGLRR